MGNHTIDCQYCGVDMRTLGNHILDHEAGCKKNPNNPFVAASQLNPENKCSHLFAQEVNTDAITIEAMFEMQASLQKNLAARGRALDYPTADFMSRVRDVTTQWRNMNLEMAELIERLPFKEWKTYTDEQKAGFSSEEEKLEVLYEYIDVFHFFMNVGLALGIDGETFKRLYATKNKENFERQARGY